MFPYCSFANPFQAAVAAPPTPKRDVQQTVVAVAAPARAASIFISLRFNEAAAHAAKLEQALHQRGHSVFLCNVTPGGDLAKSIIQALSDCELVIILGTLTYGQQTNSGFSTFEELRYTINEKLPFFLVKMCDRFAEKETRFRLPDDISYFPWQPKSESEPLPAGMVEQIERRLAEARGVKTAKSPETPSAAARPPSAHAPAGVKESLSDWLHRLELEDLSKPLSESELHTVEDTVFAAKEGMLTADMLVSHGANKFRAARLIKLAANQAA